MIRNVIWDVDGTMFDTYPAFVAAFVDVLTGYDVTMNAEKILSLVKISISSAAQVIGDEFSLDEEDLTSRFWDQYAKQPFAKQIPFPGLERVCQIICDRGGKNVIVTHRGLESTTGLLREYQLEGYIDDIVSVQSGFARKPDPEMYRVAIERNRLKPVETLAVGDREIDILASAAAGLKTCEFQPIELPSAADWVIQSYDELIELLESNR